MKKAMLFITIAILLFLLAGCTIVVSGEATPAPKRERGVNHEMQIFTGVYQGLADNNFYEVQKDGEDISKVFMITDDTRADFESMDLLKGDLVKVEYIENSYGQLVTVFIERAGETAPTGQ